MPLRHGASRSRSEASGAKTPTMSMRSLMASERQIKLTSTVGGTQHDQGHDSLLRTDGPLPCWWAMVDSGMLSTGLFLIAMVLYLAAITPYNCKHDADTYEYNYRYYTEHNSCVPSLHWSSWLNLIAAVLFIAEAGLDVFWELKRMFVQSRLMAAQKEIGIAVTGRPSMASSIATRTARPSALTGGTGSYSTSRPGYVAGLDSIGARPADALGSLGSQSVAGGATPTAGNQPQSMQVTSYGQRPFAFRDEPDEEAPVAAFDMVPWGFVAALLFVIGAIFYLFSSLIDKNCVNPPWDWLIVGHMTRKNYSVLVCKIAAVIFVVDAMIGILGRYSYVRTTPKDDQLIAVMVWQADTVWDLDFAMWGDVLFLLGAIVGTFQQFDTYRESLDWTVEGLWFLDALFYCLACWPTMRTMMKEE